METEAKFAIPSKETFAQLLGVERFGPYEKRGEKTKTVHDRYVDTPDHRFYNSQLYVRLRESTEGDILLTIKRLGAPPQGAIHARDEYQVQVPSLDRNSWPEGEVRSMVDEIAGDEPLVDLVAIQQTRTVSNLAHDDRAVAELSFDEVTVQSDNKPVTVYELEAEMLPDGNEDDLRSLVHIFSDEYHLAPQPLSKFERAMKLAGESDTGNDHHRAHAKRAELKTSQTHSTTNETGEDAIEPLLESGLAEPAAPVEGSGDAGAPTRNLNDQRARTMPVSADHPVAVEAANAGQEKGKTPGDKGKMGLEPTDSIDTASRKIVRSYFEEMVDNEKGTLQGEDIEALHDMRVATRRMRAALRVLEPYLQSADPDRLSSGLRAIARSLGAVRDTDVLIKNAVTFRGSLPEEERSGLDGLIESWQSERDKARKRLVRLLDSQDYSRLKKRIKQFIATQSKAKVPDPATMTDVEPFQVRHIAPVAILTRYEAVRAFEAITDSSRGEAKVSTRKNKGAKAKVVGSATLLAGQEPAQAQPPTIEQLHVLRINGKYLRYTLECFRETLPSEAAQIIEDVTAMQDQLGDLHDADVAAGLIKDYIDAQGKRGKNGKPQYTVPSALSAYLDERESAVRRIHTDFFSTWSRLESPEWRARLAVVILA